MENNYCLGLWRYALFSILLYGSSHLQGQSIARQSINSLGSQSYEEGIFVRQTIGQPYHTKSVTTGNLKVRPGFQQPTTFKVSASKLKSDLNLNVKVFPNPATNRLSLASDEHMESATVQVVDLQGNLIYEESFDSFQKTDIACSHWQEGIYILTLSNVKNQKYTSKLIITK